jgi:hypothetical protein
VPLEINDWPAAPECLGTQWTVLNENQLANLVAVVLLGRARHAARVIQGAELRHLPVGALKQRLRAQLEVPADEQPYHRDGLLFEIICWVAAHQSSVAGELIADPHLVATHQGMDGLKIAVSPAGLLTRATIYEQKCTTNPRATFRGAILPAFREYLDQKRDNQLTQTANALLAQLQLTEEQERLVYHQLVVSRPFNFCANVTVEPGQYLKDDCITLFADYSDLTPNIAERHGNTLPLDDVRVWFANFAALVVDKIEAVPNV